LAWGAEAQRDEGGGRTMSQPSPAEFAERQSKLHELANKAEGLKEYILSLDIRRQGNREAAGRMRREPPEEGKVWMTSVRIFPSIYPSLLLLSRSDSLSLPRSPRTSLSLST
jgi:hypothetical protein